MPDGLLRCPGRFTRDSAELPLGDLLTEGWRDTQQDGLLDIRRQEHEVEDLGQPGSRQPDLVSEQGSIGDLASVDEALELVGEREHLRGATGISLGRCFGLGGRVV